MNDENIENEVTTMTKTFYDPEVEKRGIEKGIEKGREEGIIGTARNLLDILDDKTIAEKTGLDIEFVKKLRVEV